MVVEMEGEGFMRAAYTNKVDGMVVRGVSDLLDGKAEADSSGSQEVASDHAAAFAFELGSADNCGIGNKSPTRRR
jgi:nucleoside phosphorylase